MGKQANKETREWASQTDSRDGGERKKNNARAEQKHTNAAQCYVRIIESSLRKQVYLFCLMAS
jgi:hypothetical protein